MRYNWNPGNNWNPGKKRHKMRPNPWTRKSWKKPHNLSVIPGTAGNPGKNLTIWRPSPRPPEILKKTSQYYGFAWLLLLLLLFRQAVQRPPAGAKTSQSEPHPLGRRKSWKKPHNITDLLGWLVVVVVGSDKLCRGPLRGQTFPAARAFH